MNIKAKPPKLSNVTKTSSEGPKAESVESEEGILDVSVDELEVESKESPSPVRNGRIEVKKENASPPEKVEGEMNGSISNIEDEINAEQFSDDKPGDLENHKEETKKEAEETTKSSSKALMLNGKKSPSLNGHVVRNVND